MLHSLSSQDLGVRHVTAAEGSAFPVALASATAGDVAFGAGLEIALARVGDAQQPPEWIQLFPAGPDIKARDGRKWTLRDPQVLLAAFKHNNADLALDVEHASELKAPKGDEAPAQAWIAELQVRADGTTWGRPDWNTEGARKVLAREYRYISPAFKFDAAGNIVRLTSVALVTQPALDMPALAHVDPTHDNQDPAMNLLQRMIAAYGLAATATDDDVIAAVTPTIALASATRDPTRFVPATDLTAALTRATVAETALASIQTEAATAAADELVEAAISAGKIPPDSKDHWLGLARENPDLTGKALASMPALLKPTDRAKKPGAESGNEHGLDADQVALCRQNGWDQTAFAATLKELA